MLFRGFGEKTDMINFTIVNEFEFQIKYNYNYIKLIFGTTIIKKLITPLSLANFLVCFCLTTPLLQSFRNMQYIQCFWLNITKAGQHWYVEQMT